LPIAPDPEKLSAAIASLDQVMKRAIQHFGVDIDDKDSPARNGAPMRSVG